MTGSFQRLCVRGFKTSSSSFRSKVVLLGSGWGSYSALKAIDKKLFDVIVVSPRNHFLFTPLLTSTTVGTLEFRSIIEPIRNTRFRSDHHFQLARAVDLKHEDNVLICEPSIGGEKYSLHYDKLVIGVGGQSNTFGIPGVKENAFFLKEVEDARLIRNKIISNFELSLYPYVSNEQRRRLLHFVIVGGGPTGVEFGAELYDFITEDVSRLFSQEKADVQVSLVEAAEILPSFDQKLRDFATKKLKQRSNYHLIQDSVVEVGKDYVKLKNGGTVPCGMVVWSTGLSPRPFIESLQFEKSRGGQLIVDQYLKVKGISSGNVFCIGDCSAVEGTSHPCTARIAEREGRYVADSLNLMEKGESFNVKPFQVEKLGMLTYIGDYKALADLPFKGGKLTGFKTWFLWRSAYLTRLGSWRLRMQVRMIGQGPFYLGEIRHAFSCLEVVL